MSFISKFQTIESKIENLTTFQKIELILIPILISFVLFFSFTSIKNDLEVKNIEKEIQNIKSKKLKKSYLSFIEEYTNFIKSNGLFLKSIDIKHDEIYIVVNGNEHKLLKLLFFIESTNEFSSFSYFTFKKETETFELNVYINYKEFFLKNRDFDFEKKVISLEQNSLKVDSIIGGFISIDHVWLSSGDYIKKNRITKIENGFVHFENGKKLKVVKDGDSK